ncbi:MAG: YdcF family protein [Myxococcota bacterium]
MVLGAAVVGDTPSAVYAARIDHAVGMYHDDRVARLIFTGGTGPGDTSSEAEAGRAYAVARGPFLAREAWFLLGYELARPFRSDLARS